MKSILFKKGVSIVMTAAVLLSTAGFQAVTAGARALFLQPLSFAAQSAFRL